MTPSDPEEDRRQIAEAVEVARRGGRDRAGDRRQRADFARSVVVAASGRPRDPRPGRPAGRTGATRCSPPASRSSRSLFNGRPLSIDSLERNGAGRFSSAGTSGRRRGRAVADVLFGDFNPGGKLPITIPRSAGHLPAFYNYKPSARRGYLFDDVSPLYPFGYGLSYTTFAIGEPAAREEERYGATADRVSASTSPTRARARAAKSCRCTSATGSVRSRGRSRS